MRGAGDGRASDALSGSTPVSPRMIPLRTALPLLLPLCVLCARSSSPCLRPDRSPAALLCRAPAGAATPGRAWGSLLLLLDLLGSASSRERRTPAPASPRLPSRTKARGSVKGGRRSRVTLSLDLPTDIMKLLFDVAKSKHLRAKAAENARLLAQVGRRK
ncbi:urocortin 3, like [Synchiropus splendidus]|uniref:urocortin 3, like n=1 Tax=Synchiropus splendidus TaxID=270530 RepID=UPI00237E2B62|nr:urocortin 3, like [Synchiropus splendidus]